MTNETQEALKLAVKALEASTSETIQHYDYFKLVDEAHKTCKEALKNYRTKKSLAKIKLDFIKNQLDNFKIVQLSDVHIDQTSDLKNT